MENNTLSKYTVSFGLSLAVCSGVNALLVVAKEKSPAVQAAMKHLTGHHWITHATMVVVLFVVLGFVFAGAGNLRTMPANRLIKIIVAGVCISGLIIVGFYLVAD